MKSRFLMLLTAIALLAALAVPLQLAAQDNQQRNNNPKHHHYQLIDMSTFGGPQSYVNAPPNSFAPILNNRGMVTGWADTSTPDPYPNFCFNPDCFVSHAFRWDHGQLRDLGALPTGASSASTWISANGLVSGFSQNGETDPLIPGFPEVRAVLWQNGGITDLGVLEGGYESIAQAVNNRGQVVGLFTNTNPDQFSMLGLGYQVRAFMWQNGVMQDLGTLGGSDAQALLINERGQVVGWSYTSSDPGACAGAGLALTTDSYIWEEGKGMRDLGSLGGTCTVAADINNRGQVVGTSWLTGDQSYRAFLWENGELQDLGGSFGGDSTGALAINQAGEAVGFGFLAGNSVHHAALWRQVGHMTDLGTLVNGDDTFAFSINAKSQVVGAEFGTGAGAAFLWENDTIVDLNTLILPGSALYLTASDNINDRGEIAGSGVDANGNGHGFLLIPCDENHPGVEGCDYSMVDATAVTRGSAAPVAQERTTATPSTLRSFGRHDLTFNLRQPRTRTASGR
jgi:probable HAF family extracellular repeat protein